MYVFYLHITGDVAPELAIKLAIENEFTFETDHSFYGVSKSFDLNVIGAIEIRVRGELIVGNVFDRFAQIFCEGKLAHGLPSAIQLDRAKAGHFCLVHFPH